MNLLERVLTLLRVNLNSMVEKADDPEKVLRQLQIDMRNQLMQVKTQVATAISEGRKLHSRAKEKKVEAEVWHRKAEHAIQQNNDTAARSALSRYNEIIRQVQRYQQEQLLEKQLNALKAKKRPVMETPLLHEGNPHRSPLIPSQPQNNTPARKRPETKSEEHKPSDAQSGAKELDIMQLKKLMEQ